MMTRQLPLLAALAATPLAWSSTGQTDPTALVATPAPRPSSEALVLRRYDLESLGLERNEPPTEVTWFSPATVRSGETYERNKGETFGPEDILETCIQSTGGEFEFEGRALWLDDAGVMTVRAPESVQQKVSSIVDFFAATVGQRVPVRLDVIRFPSRYRIEPESLGVLDSVQAEALRKSATQAGGHAESLVMHVAPGSLTEYDGTSREELLLDYDVEVAQNTMCYDPRMVEVLSGTRVALDCQPAEGGVDLTLILRDSAPRTEVHEVDISQQGFVANETQATFISGPRFLQSYAKPVRSMAMDAYLPAGGVLALQSTLSLEGGEGTQLVLVEPLGPLPSVLTQGPEGLYAIHMGALAGHRMHVFGVAEWCEVPRWNMTRLGWEDEPLMRVERHGRDWDAFLELLDASRPDLPFMIQSGAWAIGRGDDELARELAAEGRLLPGLGELVGSAQSPTENVRVSLRITRAGQDGSRGLSYDGMLMLGTTAALSLGVEGTYVRDYDVEIAQGSSVMDPITSLYHDGAALILEPRRARDGGLTLQLRGVAQLLAEHREFSPRTPMFRALDLLRFDRLAVDQVVQLPAGGGTVILGDQAAHPREGSLRMELTLE